MMVREKRLYWGKLRQVVVRLLGSAMVTVSGAGMSGAAVGEGGGEHVTVYSHRHYEADEKLYEAFTGETGIGVKVVTAGADELIERLVNEGETSPADVLVTVDAGRLHRAKEKGVLQPVESAVLAERVPENLRDPEGYWFGLTVRARVIVYATGRVKPEQLSTYEALAGPEWDGKVVARSSSNIYNQSLLASLLAAHGPERAKAWAAGVRENMPRAPRGSDRDQIRAVADGLADVALANTYYLGLLKTSSDPKDVEAFGKVAPFFPNQDGRGTHINVSGAGVTKSAKNRAGAVRLLEFLTSPEAQKVFAESNFEFPANPDVEVGNELLKSWGSFKRDPLPLAELGERNPEAVRIFDAVGWE